MFNSFIELLINVKDKLIKPKFNGKTKSPYEGKQCKKQLWNQNLIAHLNKSE